MEKKLFLTIWSVVVVVFVVFVVVVVRRRRHRDAHDITSASSIEISLRESQSVIVPL